MSFGETFLQHARVPFEHRGSVRFPFSFQGLNVRPERIPVAPGEIGEGRHHGRSSIQNSVKCLPGKPFRYSGHRGGVHRVAGRHTGWFRVVRGGLMTPCTIRYKQPFPALHRCHRLLLGRFGRGGIQQVIDDCLLCVRRQEGKRRHDAFPGPDPVPNK